MRAEEGLDRLFSAMLISCALELAAWRKTKRGGRLPIECGNGTPRPDCSWLRYRKEAIDSILFYCNLCKKKYRLSGLMPVIEEICAAILEDKEALSPEAAAWLYSIDAAARIERVQGFNTDKAARKHGRAVDVENL